MTLRQIFTDFTFAKLLDIPVLDLLALGAFALAALLLVGFWLFALFR